MGYEDLRQKVPSLKAPLMIGLSFLFHQYIEHRRNVMRADKFVPQYMRVSHQASYSIFFICTCNHEVVVFYDTPSLFIFCYCASNIFSFGNAKRNTSLLFPGFWMVSCYITNVYYLPFISTSIYKCQHYDYILHCAWNC